MANIVFLLLGGLICGIVAAIIGKAKGRRPGAWFFIGLSSGIVGVLIAAFAGSRKQARPLSPSPAQPAGPSGGAPQRAISGSRTPSLETEERDLQPASTSRTRGRSADEVLGELLREVLGDAIPRPRKEKKASWGPITVYFPWYRVRLRRPPYGEYGEDHARNVRIRERLHAMHDQIDRSICSCYAAGRGNRYDEIARVPTFFVSRVECQTKHRGPWETVFRNFSV